jgi:hypothetical protein
MKREHGFCVGIVVLLMVGCGGGSSDKPAATPAAVSGTVVPPAGAAAGDYEVYPSTSAQAAAKVDGNGAFSSALPGDRTGVLMAVPREGSASATALGGGKGILLAPVFGNIVLAKNGAGLLYLSGTNAGPATGATDGGAKAAAVDGTSARTADGGLVVSARKDSIDANPAVPSSADGGSQSYPTVDGAAAPVAPAGVVLDGVTTVLSTLLFHPMLANPNPAASKQVAEWLVAKANGGWPELQAATLAFDRAADLSAPAFQTALAALFQSVVATLPTALVAGASAKILEDGQAPPTVKTTSQGAVCMAVTVDNPKTPSITVDDSAGTNLDYLCVVRATSKSDFPAGADSPAFATPNRLGTVPSGTAIRSAFVGAKSYASYLDVVGNTIGLVTNLIGGATIGPNNAIPLPNDQVSEIRCLSGGYGTDADAPVYNFVAANLAADARSAFVHNVTAATIEVMSAIPGADTAMKSEVGKSVLAKVVQQAVFEIEAKANSQGKKLGSGDVYEIIYNVARAGLNEMIDKSSDEWRKGQLEKLAAFLKWGGKSLVKIVDVSGKVANAGAAGTRAYALARPQSLMEYFLVAVGGSKPDAATTPDAVTSTDPNFDSDGFEKSLKACRKMLDLKCAPDQFDCPDQITPSRRNDPYHDCMIAGIDCILASSTCDEVWTCHFSTTQWPDDLAVACGF